MIKFVAARKVAAPLLLFVLSAFIITFQSCKKKRSEIANILYKKTHNKILKDFTPEGYQVVFKQVFNEEKHKLSHAGVISEWYGNNHYEPVFVLNHLFNGDLSKAHDDYLMHAAEHGLSPEIFHADELAAAIEKPGNMSHVKTIDEAYHDIADLEISAANSLIDYSNALQFGVINPKYIYQRYYMATKRPDNASMSAVFNIADMQGYLEGLQPKAPQYIALQNALKNNYEEKGFTGEECKRIILVNLERLRWRNKPYENKYVTVNIPDYTLSVVDSGKPVLKMKVCVGQGRNVDNKNTLLAYNDTCKVDKPGDHETPLLNSLIYGVEVNPVWNIPRSIANKEIIVEAAKDKFYLENNNIDVYKDDKLVENPEDIDWTNITKENLPYSFKQEPGTSNSLGLIKFIFNNNSSIYLHDTPVKWVFSQKMRAVSHGCIRLGDPKGLAQNLFGESDKFKTISDDMQQDNPDPTTIYLPKKTPVYITYITCWADEDGKLQFRNDVYGLDIVLYDHLQKMLHPGKS
ncbi:L,D-transpeptidase family protein [Mucilaginibacter sp.]|uniref:L,D-transpeptidase family protein n=1 Tax=Mucilaginibacter sp. TaxID=1882438 RepID=UPI00283B9B9F|nr:L,D-transpeptidase family protein [Mucilaginibacter sp.]MDR3693771.1 L,D-transpeptidase family protein [Mucilaginibacter sp.]